MFCVHYTRLIFLIRRDLDRFENHTSIYDCFGYKLWSSQFQNLIFEKKNPKREIQFDQRKLMPFDWPVIEIIKLLTWTYSLDPIFWKFKGSSDPNHFIFWNKCRIRHRTTLNFIFTRFWVDRIWIIIQNPVVLCRIRLFPTMISKMKWVGSKLLDLKLTPTHRIWVRRWIKEPRYSDFSGDIFSGDR